MFCGAYRVIKKGARNGINRYFCKACGKSRSSSRRRKKLENKIWKEYVWHKQTRMQLAKRHRKSLKTIERFLDRHETEEKIHQPRNIVAVMDATYFGRKNGVLVARDPNKKENLGCHGIASETKEEYQKMRDELEKKGYVLKAVVLDGKRGIPSVFSDIPVQICQYHQWQIVRRKLTLRPKLESHQALLSIARKLTKTDRTGLKRMLEAFAKCFHEDLNEKTYTIGTKRWRYTHAKLRSAYLSLVRNLPYLYTYQDYPELKIPNTTNSLDGTFNSLKSHVNVHRGLRPDRRMKIIREYLRV